MYPSERFFWLRGFKNTQHSEWHKVSPQQMLVITTAVKKPTAVKLLLQ